MMELPEAVTIARQWNETVCGKPVTCVRAGETAHRFAFFEGDPAGYPALLEGRKAGEARALGGMLEIAFAENRLLLGDGASPRYHAPGAPRPAKRQLLLEFADGSAVSCTIRMYGGMWAYEAGARDENFYYRAACDKPSPLSDAFDEAYFTGLLAGAKPNLSVKAFLATEQRIPGLGNGCLQDILFCAGVNPKTKLAALADAELAALFRETKAVLARMAALGGRDVEKDFFGNDGGYRAALSQRTVRYPCPKCGGVIVRQAYLGGNVYFCPDCQPPR